MSTSKFHCIKKLWAYAIAFFLAGCAEYTVPRQRICVVQEQFFPRFSEEWIWPTIPHNDPDNLSRSNVAVAADGLIHAYQMYLRRPIRPGEGCRFYPSCSVYARTSFRRYGVFFGFILTLDRLFIREHRANSNYYPSICVGLRDYLYDPVP